MGALDLTWWQAALGLLTLTGLSAAPWIVGLLRGALVPRSTVNALLAEKATAAAKVDEAKQARIDGLTAELERAETRRKEDVAVGVVARDQAIATAQLERSRSDEAMKSLMQLTREYGETMLDLARGVTTGEAKP